MSLGEKLARVREDLGAAAKRAGRDLSEITLVGVSKTAPRPAIEEAFRLGLRDFGENRVSVAEEKFTPLPYPPNQASLHLIGHLQTNKARRAVKLFDIIHSVDDLRLAQSLNRYCAEFGKKMPILIQVNVSGEESKEGLAPVELGTTLEQVLRLDYLEVRGLMTLAPYTENPEEVRPVFARLQTLFEKHHPGTPAWRTLSMGMTNDFEVAIEEGATIVRVGRAIFQ
ncbi:MAG: YggS family pyridoxal phosphate-dependent enzyme [Chloroflexota bacterium]|nr:YggS family pyridoxal phosphate-dependent enzyme [Chloroflexota bacterium]